MQLYRYTGGVMVTVERDIVTRVQILDEVVCISYNANTLGRSMNQIILSAMGKE